MGALIRQMPLAESPVDVRPPEVTPVVVTHAPSPPSASGCRWRIAEKLSCLR